MYYGPYTISELIGNDLLSKVQLSSTHHIINPRVWTVGVEETNLGYRQWKIETLKPVQTK